MIFSKRMNYSQFTKSPLIICQNSTLGQGITLPQVVLHNNLITTRQQKMHGIRQTAISPCLETISQISAKESVGEGQDSLEMGENLAEGEASIRTQMELWVVAKPQLVIN